MSELEEELQGHLDAIESDLSKLSSVVNELDTLELKAARLRRTVSSVERSIINTIGSLKELSERQ